MGSSLEVCARECQISENTANRWRHKISMALYLSEFHDISLEGKVELDETLYERLNAPESDKKKRGISDQKVNIACAIDENKIIQVSIPGESLLNHSSIFTKIELKKVLLLYLIAFVLITN